MYLRSVQGPYRRLKSGLWTLRAAARRWAVQRAYHDEPYYLSVGGGWFARENWRVLDFPTPAYPYPKWAIDHVVDLLRCEDWAIASGSVAHVYASHCLEHLPDDAARKTLSEAFRVLKPGGVLRVAVPDFELAWEAFARKDRPFFDRLRAGSEDDEAVFLAWFAQARSFDPRQLREDFEKLERQVFADRWSAISSGEAHDHGRHSTWFDWEKLQQLGESAGFARGMIRRSGFRQSIVAEMRNVEFDRTAPELTLYVEMIR